MLNSCFVEAIPLLHIYIVDIYRSEVIRYEYGWGLKNSVFIASVPYIRISAKTVLTEPISC